MTSMVEEVPSATYTEWAVGKLEIPCEDLDPITMQPRCSEPARWIFHLKPCCPAAPRFRLYCEACKERRINNQLALQCPACGHVWVDGSDAYYLIEAL